MLAADLSSDQIRQRLTARGQSAWTDGATPDSIAMAGVQEAADLLAAAGAHPLTCQRVAKAMYLGASEQEALIGEISDDQYHTLGADHDNVVLLRELVAERDEDNPPIPVS